MSYTKLNLTNGTIINENHFAHIETGIAEAHEAIALLQANGGTSGGTDSGTDSGTSGSTNTNTQNILIEPSETISSAYLSGKKIYPLSEAYSVDVYNVTAGTEYLLYSEGARINIAETMALFTTDKTVSAQTVPAEAEVIIAYELTDGQKLPIAYNVTYVPAVDGYILISRVNDVNDLAVYLKGTGSGSDEGSDDGGATTKPALKIQAFGDSITAENWGGGNSWVSYLAESLSGYDVTIVNSAVGGNTLTQMGDSLYKGIAWQVGLAETTTGLADAAGNNQYAPVDADADVVIVFAGTNDWAGTNRALATGGFAESDKAVIDGAVRSIIEELSTNHPATRLLFVTPTQRNNYKDQEQITNGVVDDRGNPKNAASGCTLEEVADAIVETCGYFGIPCLDMYHTGGFNRINISTFSGDGLHPNQEGHQRIAARIAATLRTLL